MPNKPEKMTRPKFSEELVSILDKLRSASTVAQALHDIATGKVEAAPAEDDSALDYLSVSSDDPQRISYLTPVRAAAIEATAEDSAALWTSSKRYHGRPAVVASRILGGAASLKDLEVFSNVYKAAAGIVKFDFKVVSGEAIRHWYHEGTYVKGCGGSLGQSCMKHPVCQGFLDLYVDNDDAISMLVMVDKNGMLLGRALLWDFDLADGSRARVMDRIYTAKDDDLPYHFKMWAQENGYMHKSAQKWNNSLDFIENGQPVRKRLSLRLKSHRYDAYPYMDTFKFLNGRNGELSNHLAAGVTKTLSSADGTVQRPDWLAEDFADGLYHHRGEMVPITYIEGGQAGPRMTHASNVRYSEINEVHILRQHCMHDPVLGDHLFVGEYSHLNDKSRIRQAARLRAKMDFGTYVQIACKNMTFAQVMARHHELQDAWQQDLERIGQMVDAYYE